MKSYVTRARGFAKLTVLAASVLTSAVAPAAPCPTGSAEQWFTYQLDAKNCILGSAEGNPPRATQGRYYNVYCPGRMTKENAVAVARALTNGSTSVGGYRVINEYKQTYNLKPEVYGEGTLHASNSIVHLNHYNCQTGGKNGVATHFKVHVIARPNAVQIASFAAKKKDSGQIKVGKSFDREYYLPVHIKSQDRVMADYVGIHALTRDTAIRSQLAKANARMCVMLSTDIQCAPCASSDKLVVRTQLVAKGRACPPEHRGWIESDRSSNHPNGYP